LREQRLLFFPVEDTLHFEKGDVHGLVLLYVELKLEPSQALP
jgi:hypothetical protein